MAPTSIVVVGTSAGGVTALRALTAGLAKPLPAAILIVLHVGALPSELPALLNAAGVTPAKHGEDREVIRPGHIYVAPPDRHMIVVEGRVGLTRGPKENWARPAIDPLFRSVAESFGPAAIGIVLTGNLNDGTAGLYEIKQRGGIAIVQDPDDAANPAMPKSAQLHVKVDYCLPLAAIPALLERLVIRKEGVMTTEPHKIAPEDGLQPTEDTAFDRPVTITCPDCGGALRRSTIGGIVRYTCHIKHIYTAEVMAAAQFNEMERVMRSAERMLNERAEFCRQMAEGSDPYSETSREVWRTASQEALARAYTLRDFVEQDWITPHAATFGALSKPREADA